MNSNRGRSREAAVRVLGFISAGCVLLTLSACFPVEVREGLVLDAAHAVCAIETDSGQPVLQIPISAKDEYTGIYSVDLFDSRQLEVEGYLLRDETVGPDPSIGRTYADLKTLASKVPTRSLRTPSPASGPTASGAGSASGGYLRRLVAVRPSQPRRPLMRAVTVAGFRP